MADAAVMPRVTVVIPCYNVAAYIAEALQSVFAQTFTAYEVIVVNDGSPDTDEFERALAPYRTRVTYLRKRNGGVSSARNAAIWRTHAEFIALHDPDDGWLPNFLEYQVNRLDADPSIDMIYSDAAIMGEVLFPGETCMSRNPSDGEVTFESLLELRVNPISIGTVVRRSAVEKAGYFDEELHTGEDYDLWLRILKNGGRIVYHREALAKYRRRHDSLTANPVRAYCQNVRLLEKLPQKVSLTPAERRLVHKRLADVKAHVALHQGRYALFAGKPDLAIERLGFANAHFRKLKLSVTVWILRFAPNLVLRLFDWRDRRIFGRRTRPAVPVGAPPRVP